MLEKKSPNALITVLEILVGALRGVDLATNVDVEIYLKKFDGFYSSMSKVDYKSIPYHRAETWSTVLAALDNDFRDPELAEFIPYVAFTWKVIKLVVICRDEKTVEDSI